jgi:isopentenyl-diphosphate delta-isomerase
MAVNEYPPIQVVDENDNPVGGGEMDEIHRKGLLHRIVTVILRDPNGRVLLQRRGPHVSTNPNIWDASAAGHVDEGEDYLTAAQRELFEELGIENPELVEAAYYRTNSMFEWRKLNRFNQVYVAIVPEETEFIINPEEVTEVKWFTPAELEDLIKNHPNEIVEDFSKVLAKINENNEH